MKRAFIVLAVAFGLGTAGFVVAASVGSAQPAATAPGTESQADVKDSPESGWSTGGGTIRRRTPPPPAAQSTSRPRSSSRRA